MVVQSVILAPTKLHPDLQNQATVEWISSHPDDAWKLIEKLTTQAAADKESLNRATSGVIPERWLTAVAALLNDVKLVLNGHMAFADMGANVPAVESLVSAQEALQQIDQSNSPSELKNPAPTLAPMGVSTPIQLVVTIEAGCVVRLQGSHPIDVLVLDSDTEGADQRQVIAFEPEPDIVEHCPSEFYCYAAGSSDVDPSIYAVAREFLARVEDDAQTPTTQSRYVVCEAWGHIFAGKTEQMTRWIFDRKQNLLIDAQVQGYSLFSDLDHLRAADLLESLVDNEAIDNPQDYDCDETDVLPSWAEQRLQVPICPDPDFQNAPSMSAG